MRTLEELFQQNRAWAHDITSRDPQFFLKLSSQQTPRYLWIGCADSRVPANEIVGLAPGELFVHRNVANVVVHSDLNCLSVLQYAVEVLHVGHVIVCGHYGCGGVRAALDGAKLGLIDNWLRHVQDVRNRNRDELGRLQDPHARMMRLCELNVLSQAINVAETTLLQDAWARGQPVAIHSLIYGLDNGILHQLGPSLEEPSAVEQRKRALGW